MRRKRSRVRQTTKITKRGVRTAVISSTINRRDTYHVGLHCCERAFLHNTARTNRSGEVGEKLMHRDAGIPASRFKNRDLFEGEICFLPSRAARFGLNCTLIDRESRAVNYGLPLAFQFVARIRLATRSISSDDGPAPVSLAHFSKNFEKDAPANFNANNS